MARASRVEKATQLREELLQAAAREFSEHGFVAARLQSIAEAVGVTKGAIYANFATKAELYQAALSHERLTDSPFVAIHGGWGNLKDETLSSEEQLLRFAQHVARELSQGAPASHDALLVMLDKRRHLLRDQQRAALLAQAQGRAREKLATWFNDAANCHGATPSMPGKHFGSAVMALVEGAATQRGVSEDATIIRALPEAVLALYRGAMRT